MREKDIERILVHGVQKLGGAAYKFISPGNDGVPDRLVVMPEGKVCFVELKQDTGKLSGLQRVQIRKLAGIGQNVAVLYGEDEVRVFLNQMRSGDVWLQLQKGLWM
ncbi:MAG: VRR-NUC domain-containing protein [Firmicutes bacterium]|nr:VRR-NUC domain-containing protein [Bacillota bacterium]